MAPVDVNALLESCDQTTPAGRRDLAILSLLARLGPSGEVAALQLSDVDWRVGEILVRGKARRQDRLPPPVEVGEALVGSGRIGEWLPQCDNPYTGRLDGVPPRLRE